jgi:hypothetical protein
MKYFGKTILISAILIMAVFQVVNTTQNVEAESWTQTTQTDFENGDKGGVLIEPSSGDLKLQPSLYLPYTTSGDDQANAAYGYSVSNAGDVNGDGYDDVIVGAAAYTTPTPRTAAGKAYLYYGSSTGLSSTEDWYSYGDDQANAGFGYSVSTAGDVNGDGYDDVIVGAPFYDTPTPNTDAGKAYVYLGSSTGLLSSPSWSSSGDDQANAEYGYSVSTAGDVNGDGYDDVIVGAWGFDTPGPNNEAGKAYVYLGSSTGLTMPAATSWESSGDDQAGAYYGLSVSNAGDVNGDGYDDVIVGASLYDTPTPNTAAGKAYLYLGEDSAAGLSSTEDWYSYGDDQASAAYGYSVSTAGDVNSDGYDDWIVGCYGFDTTNSDAGKAYLYLGQDSGYGLSTSTSWTSSGDDVADTHFSQSISLAGDVNGDGYDDILVGAPQYLTTNTDAGKVYLYLGSITGILSLSSWTSSGDDQANAEYGWSVSTIGDVNRDGFDDIMIGAPSYDTSNSNAGKAYLYYGSIAGLSLINSWSSSGDNDQSGAYYGYSVSNAGDINSDGFDDVIVGAYSYTTANSNAGKAYLYLGSPTGLSLTASWTSSGDDQANAEFGISVSTAGDVNGDGYDDVIVGAYKFDTTNSNAGKAYLYFGSPTGLFSSPSWTSSGDDQANAEFGISVSTAGDVNGDGYDDVIIGSEMYDNASSDEGKAYLYLGSPSGLSSSPSWTSCGDNQIQARYGYSVSTAGDVNGDGYDDVIVGAWNYDTPGPKNAAGKAYVYLGEDTIAGLSSAPSWTSSGDDVADSHYGASVSNAGDVNGDGYDDIIVGAHDYDTPNSDAGKAYVYLGEDSNAGVSSIALWTSIGDDQVNANYGLSVSTAGDINGDGYDDVIVGAVGYTTPTPSSAAGKAYLYLGLPSGLSSSTSWTSSGDDQANALYGYSVSTAGDINGNGYEEIIVGAKEYDTTNSNAGKAYLYQNELFEYGAYTSTILDSKMTTPTVWHSIQWEPQDQLVNTTMRLQIATSDYASSSSWNFVGPDGTSNSYFRIAKGHKIEDYQRGRYLRFRAYFETENITRTPKLRKVTLLYGEELELSVKVTSPNGGEMLMKGDSVPVIWEASGNLDPLPVLIWWSYDGNVWQTIGSSSGEANDGVCYWTIPGPSNRAHAIVKVEVYDKDGRMVSDTSDVSFAIDPPIESAISDNEDDSSFVDNNGGGGENVPESSNFGIISWIIISSLIMILIITNLIKRKQKMTKKLGEGKK